jgi:broad specificity phosphatase PhoE
MTPIVPTVFLIRHATPDWSRADIPYDVPPGPPLTLQGEEEAMQLGQFLREAGVTQIYARPLVRAWHTAQIAATVSGAPAQQSESLAEWRNKEEVSSIRARFWPIWEEVSALSQHSGPIALITHGGPIAFLLEELGLPSDVVEQHKRQFDRRNPLPPAGAWRAMRLNGNPNWDLTLAFTPASRQNQKSSLFYV